MSKTLALLLVVLPAIVANPPAEGAAKLAAGWRHSAVVDDQGYIRMWGENRMGQLGAGDFAARRGSVYVAGPNGKGQLDRVVAVAAGTHHTLAIRDDGTLWTWGNNAFGQLGNGQWGLDAHSAAPVQVLGPNGEGALTDVVAVAAGWDHSVALRKDGTVWAWGSACHGQLGDGADPNRWSTHPVQVPAAEGNGSLDHIRAVACGAFHTIALRDDGTVWSWGGNWEGQLGNRTVSGRRHEHRHMRGIRLAWMPPSKGRWTIALEYTYSDPGHRDAVDRVALTDTYKEAATVVDAQPSKPADEKTAHTARNRDYIEAVSTLRYPAAAQVGQQTLLTLDQARFGQTVDDDVAEDVYLLLTNAETGQAVRLACDTTAAFPTQVAGLGGEGHLSNVKAVSAGMFHNVALLDDGRAVAWGYNGAGQLGEGTRGGFWSGNTSVRHMSAPVLVVGLDRKGVLDDIAAVGAGYEASWALLRDGTMRSWGWNVYGELGSGRGLGTNRDHPQVVCTGPQDELPPLKHIVAFAGGMRHVLARDEKGDLWVWGHNGFGQLGIDDRTDQSIAVPMPESAGNTVEPPVESVPGPAAETWKRELHFALPQDARTFDVRNFDAFGDGAHLDMPAIQAAVNAAHEAGGGIVMLPPGTYRTGSIELKSGVNLHLQKGAVLLGSTNRNHYPFPGLIYADGAHDIAITGPGVIDGQGQAFPSRGWRVQIFYLNECTGVNVCDVTTQNSGSWTQHYIRCRNLNIRGATVNSPRPGRNNDGIDLSGCEDVLIEQCLVISDDDGIVIKSQALDRANRDYRVLDNCVLTYRGAFKLGTETRGPYSNLVVRKLRGAGAKALELYSVDGTEMENIDIEDVRIDDAISAIQIRLGGRLRPSYFQPGEKQSPGYLRNVRIKDVHVTLANKSFREVLRDRGIENAGAANGYQSSPRPCFISGLPEHPVEDVVIEDVTIRKPGSMDKAPAVSAVPEKRESYPASYMFGRLPAWGFFMRHADGVTLRDIRLELLSPDSRPPLADDDVRNLRTEDVMVRKLYEE